MSIKRHRRRTWRSGLLALGLVVTLLPAIPAAAAFTANPTHRINAGGAHTTPFGADQGFSGGTTFSNSNIITMPDVYDPAPAAVYQSERRGVFTYTMGGLTASARYTVRLHFAEIVQTGANQRKFNVAINGTGVLSEFDIYAYTGGANRAVVRSFNSTANASGNIVVSFTNGTVGTPKVSGIEVVPGFSYKVGSGNTAPSGEFGVDAMATGGSTLNLPGPVDRTIVGSPPPVPVYENVRFGASFSYTFPNLNAGGKYHVRLHFAEVSPFTTLPGQRVFDVSINGGLILDNFDIREAAGAHRKAVVRQFFINATSPGATITVSFTGVVSDAMVNGIEVVPMRSYAVDSGGFGATGFAPNGYVHGGSDQSYAGTVDTSLATNPAPQSVYQTEHFGTTGTPRFYHLFDGLMPSAIYRVRLHFAENFKTGIGQRIFDVSVNNAAPTSLPELSLVNYDIWRVARDRYGVADGAHKAVVEELSTHADAAGNIRVDFFGDTDNPVIHGVEIFPEPDIAAGYHAMDIGRLGQPSGLYGRDGKASALLGNGASAKMLWTYGDTFLSGLTDATTIPPSVKDWTNTGASSDIRTPQNSTEQTVTTGGTQKSKAMLIPYTTDELNYTIDCHYSPPCTQATTGSRYLIWPSAAIRLPSTGNVVVIGETNLNLFPANACYINCPPMGVAAATVTAGTVPGSGTRHPFLFTYCERRYSDGGWDDGTHAYLYRSMSSEMGEDCATGTGNYQWNKIGSTWSQCGPTPLSACPTTQAGFPYYNQSRTRATGTSTTDHALWQFVGNQFEFHASKQPDAGQVELSVLDAANNVVWGPQTYNLYDPQVKGDRCIIGWSMPGPFVTSPCEFATPTLPSVGTYKLKVRPTGVPGAGGGRVVTIDSAQSREMVGGAPRMRAYVARAPLTNVLSGSAYTVWNKNCSCWDANKANATPMDGPTAGSYGPALGLDDIGYNVYLGKYIATMTSFPDNEIWMYTAPNPWGPWSAGVRIANGSNGEAIYASSYHPEMDLSGGQTIHITYSRSNNNFRAEVRVVQVVLPPL